MSPVSVFAQPNAGTDTKAPATTPVAGHDAKSTGAGDAKSTDAGKDAVKGKTGTTDAAKAGTAKSSSAKAGTTPATTGTPAKTGG
jgi:hypothetical protein